MTHNLDHANGGGFLLGSAASEEPWLADGLDHDAMLEYTSSALDTLSRAVRLPRFVTPNQTPVQTQGRGDP